MRWSTTLPVLRPSLRAASKCFIGKERDETGLDYFGARYYSNGLGRFITPDWADKATAVPYAVFGDPQTGGWPGL